MKKVIIIGAGIIGASISRELAKYKIDITVLEKENDVCEGTSCANSAIIHSGYDPLPNTLMAKCNVLGNQMFDELKVDLGFEFERIGSLTLANTDEECEILEELFLRAKQNHVPARIVDQDELRVMEPNVTKKAKKALFCPTAGIIDPFGFNIALMENAIENGVKLCLNEEVIDIKKNNNKYVVKTKTNEYEADIVINSAGVYSGVIAKMVGIDKYNIRARKGEYYLLDHFDNKFIKHTLFNVPSSKGKGILISPTTSYNYLVGPSSEFVDDLDDLKTDSKTLDNVKNKAYDLVDFVDYSKQIKQFSGNRAVSDVHDFIISEDLPGFINLIGIQSPGLTSAPWIAIEVANMISDKVENPNFIKERKPQIRLNDLSIEERNELIKKNPNYGEIVCRCEQISRGEIIDCIHKPCGATTIKGVKKRVRAGFGKCQGGFCEEVVFNILLKELDKKPTDIKLSKGNSYIIDHELGEEND